MPKPRAVVFDLGNVLLEFDYRRTARKLAEYCTVSEKEILLALNQSPLLFQYETGLISSEEFFEKAKEVSGFCRPFAEFKALFGDIFSPIDQMIQLNEHLRSAGLPTYIFSNTNEMAIDHISNTYPFFKNFTDFILSYEHRAMKPDPRIYEIVEKRAGAKASEVLYIDDRPENVEQGRERGWQVILHRTPAETIPAVRRAID